MKLPILISTAFAAAAALTLVAQDNYPAQNYAQKKQAVEGRLNSLRTGQSEVAAIQAKIDQRNANIDEFNKRIALQETKIARASAGDPSGKNANIVEDARAAIVTASKLIVVENGAISGLSKDLNDAKRDLRVLEQAVEGAKMQYENAFTNLPPKEKKRIRDQAIGGFLKSKPQGPSRGWQCVYVNAVHSTPQECDHPEMGGRWIR